MANRTLKRRRASEKSRKQAVAKLHQPLTRTVTASRKGVVRKGPPVTVSHTSAGVLVAEGDSWFDYPFHDVLSELEDMYGFDIESVAHKGDTVEGMAYSDGQLDDFSRCVAKVLRSGVRPRAILLSGGGNDVCGDEFPVLLNHATSSIAGLNESVLAGVIDQRLRDAYITILSAITTLCEQQIGQRITIVVHGYDYPVADGRGFWGGWGPLPGPWLEPGFRKKGYGPMIAREKICTQVIDRFNQMLKGLAGKAPFEHVRHVDLRGTLRRDNTYKNWWANELHPTERGFKDVTRKIAAAI
jgi:hypothetical protein